MPKMFFQVKTNISISHIALLLQDAARFQSIITICNKEKIGHTQSIFSMLKLGIVSGDLITITAEGEDKDVAIISFYKLLLSFHVTSEPIETF